MSDPQTTAQPIKDRYRHSNGYLMCGTLRIARADFDTQPPKEIQDATLDWLARVANEAQDNPLHPAYDPDKDATHYNYDETDSD